MYVNPNLYWDDSSVRDQYSFPWNFEYPATVKKGTHCMEKIHTEALAVDSISCHEIKADRITVDKISGDIDATDMKIMGTPINTYIACIVASELEQARTAIYEEVYALVSKRMLESRKFLLKPKENDSQEVLF